MSPKGLASRRKPRLVMFAGPNGSGKSTQWIADTLNNYSASRDEQTLLIQKANKGQKVCSISLINESKHTGKIEFIGEHYVSQEVSNTEIILHHLSLIDFDLSLSQTVSIEYQDGVSSVEMR